MPRFFIIILGFSVSFCGAPEPEKSPSLAGSVRNENQPASHYYLSQSQCTPGEGHPSPVRGYIHHTLSGSLQSELVTLDSGPVGHALGGRYITQVGANARYDRLCHGGRDHRTCLNQDGGYLDWGLERSGRQIRVCSEEQTKDPESLESISLTGLYFVDRALRNYAVLTGRSLAPIRIEVVPTYASTYVNAASGQGEAVHLRRFETDNLAYFPGQYKMTLWPQSQVTYDRGQPPLWQSGFALSHEAAHHMAYEYERGYRSQVLQAVEYTSFRPAWSGEPQTGLTASQKRWKFFGAISESYADLTGYLVGGELDRDIGHLTCLGSIRNPSQGFFGGHEQKALTRGVINEFFRGNRTSICGQPNFTSIHTLGAILAAANYALITHLHPGDRKAQIRSIETWYQTSLAEATRVHSNGIADGSLFNVLGAGWSAMLSSKDGKACNLISQFAPAIAVEACR